MLIDEFWKSLSRMEQNRVALAVDLGRDYVRRMAVKDRLHKRLAQYLSDRYPKVKFTQENVFDPLAKRLARSAEKKEQKLKADVNKAQPKCFVSQEQNKSSFDACSIGEVEESFNVAKKLFERIKSDVVGSKKVVAWISNRMELCVDYSTGAYANEFFKDPAGMVGVYARRCSYFDVRNDLIAAYIKRIGQKTYVRVSA